MNIKFQEITIKNFKGVLGERIIRFNPEMTQILGANHTGKTTIIDATQWLLFGKNSDGATNFGIDPKDEKGNIIHHLENEVSINLKRDGEALTLTKTRSETWAKPRQKNEEVMNGHTVSYFVNGDKYTETDYKLYIAGMISEGLFRTITNPMYFPSLKPDDQRILLIKMVGETSPEQIAGDNEDFKAVLNQLQGTDLVTYRKHLSYKINEIKKDLETLPSRLSENKAIISNIQDEDYDEVRKKITETDEKIKETDDIINDKSKVVDKHFQERTKVRNEINKKKKRLLEIQQSCQDKNTGNTRAWKKMKDDANEKVEKISRDIRNANQEIEDANNALGKIAIRVQEFDKKWDAVEATSFVWDTNKETCPTCGQRLPEGDIEEMREKLEENFNIDKSKRQDELDKEAEEIKRRKDDAKAILSSAKEKLDELEEKLRNAKDDIADIEKKQPKLIYFVDNEEYQLLKAEIEKEEDDLNKSEEENGDDNNDEILKIKENKSELIKERDQLRDALSNEKIIISTNKRIGEIIERQKTLNQQLTELEKEDYTAEQFNMAMIKDLEERVNELFTNVRFTMFKTQLNGKTIPTCECTMHGTPYQDLSNSEKINAGIDIINAICRYNNAYAPCIIDNAESINDVLPMLSQQILLIVSRDEELTII
jgi:DNA repair exonuclease SbcCD ATPase subunit